MSAAIRAIGPDRRDRVLAWEHGRVESFGPAPSDPTPSGPAPPDRLDASLACICPGSVNAHTHIYSGLVPFDMPAPPEKPQNFLQILERIWWRLDRALDESTLRAAARYYVAKALLAGTTTLFDHHESPGFIEGSLDVIADVCQELGIRAVLCYGATERNGGREEARRGLAECRRFLEEKRRPLVRGMVGLHASFTVSDETVREAGQLCRALDAPLHVHVAEDASDVRDARDRGYLGPLERLKELRALPPGSVLAHGVYLDRDQVRKAVKWGCWLVQNPRSNLGNDVGYPRTLEESSLVALGTDGHDADMCEEQAVLLQEGLKHGERKPVLEQRLPAGRALVGERFGLSFAPLAPEGAADAVVRTEREVRHVVVGGRLVVRDGELLTGDFEAIREEARTAAARLWSRL
jgi:cytosine/adenosine deaminase-related metal-dependent hydrolase